MADKLHNVFISHKHEDDAGLQSLKALLERHGMKYRDYSVTSDKPNRAVSEDYIKSSILAPRIQRASCLVVYVSAATKNSDWVDWEIEYAHGKGKRIVGVWQRGELGCDVPRALTLYADAVVGWNGESIVDAITGKSNTWYNQNGTSWEYRSDIQRHTCG